ncbi:MAG: nitrilase-related carbon-nitrogen hydrolase, partial [Pelobium sp.]
MKIALAQLNYHIGNFEANTQKIIQTIQAQKAAGVDIVVFAELCISGYPPRDFLEYPEFIELCKASADEIAKATEGIACIIGLPIVNPVIEGKDLYNAAFFIADGEIKQVVKKALLPTYDVFDEYRYFEPAYNWNVVEFKGKRLAVTICEDIWNIDDNPLYRISPMNILIEQKPDLMINLSASPFDYIHAEERKSVIKANVIKYKLPMFYCNAVGSQTEIVFDGASLIFDKEG